MLTRRRFLKAAACLPIALAGCVRKQGAGSTAAAIPGTTPLIPITTVFDPGHAAASPQVTDHPIRFTDISQSAGLRWTFTNGATGRHLFIETVGGGVAFFDYDGDGLLDIFAVQGGPVPGATGAERNFPTRSVLYRNNGDGTFTDVTESAGLGADMGYGMGVSVADYNNDGRPDLYITAYGGNHLFRNNGDGTFTDVTQSAGIAAVSSELPWPLTSAWGDYDNDGHLDLFVCHYCRWQPPGKVCTASDGKPNYCAPEAYEPSHCRLFHNNGDGTFTDVTRAAGIDTLQGKSMGAVWLDYDGDGWMDLFVSNDSMPNFLLHNNRDGTFTDRGILAGVAYADAGQAFAGMGIAVGDYDRDGREDLFVVNFAGQPKSVFHNMGSGLFENASRLTGIANTDLRFLGFGLECFDYDNDGWLDLVVGNGQVMDRMDPRNPGSSYAQSQQLYHNAHDGTFVEDLRSLGDLVLPRVTRGLAVGDYNNDGGTDVLMVSQTGPLQLYRNDGGSANNWITFRLEGVRCNRDAYGARVTIHSPNGRQVRWVRGSSSYCSHSDSRLTFGLRDATEITEGEIVWPGGHRQQFGALSGNRFFWVREGDAPVLDPRVRKSAPEPGSHN
jgi:hypothetical protein